MMSNDKQYFFLAGLYRSGNTLLSAILNQNKDIYASPISVLSEVLWRMHLIEESQHYAINKNKHEFHRFAESLVDVFYRDKKFNVIIDKEKGWAKSANVALIKKYITKTPKIIFTTRPTLEVLASLVKNAKDVYLNDMYNSNYVYKSYLSENDNLAEFLMSNDGSIDSAMGALNSITNPDNKGMFHIVEYKDLVTNPQQTLDGIYDFLGIDRFEHDFDNIEQPDDYDHKFAGLPEDLHKIRKSISESDTDPKEIFSEHIINKYKNYNISDFI